ncbi:MAG: site-specific DNA-methyltransferase [Candidatus Omnitrophica bacterium]|nr:site-specific DNA-methyltransferase [Candidatus Omnitrophota bacterium]MBU4488259.1 site-specific DNA-methyltransferase [Candidatus Omnitrophota bacterium]
MKNVELNRVYIEDCIEFMKKMPAESVDLTFADPPYNLQKSYSRYKDDKTSHEYIAWCNLWLEQMARILKKTGSLYVLNLPKWAVYHAVFLDRLLCRQNWIVWDALSTPLGKLMPAHYALLFYTKQRKDYVFNPQTTVNDYDSCYREKCVRMRKDIEGRPVSDIWFDLHRIRHSRKRDKHPCQLPLKLLERIILASTNMGGIVFDPFMGVGTTAVVAKLLNRNFIGCEIDNKYEKIISDKVEDYNNYRRELSTIADLERSGKFF